MSLNYNLRDLRGRDDKPFSSLDTPKYAPYRDGKGQLDVGMKLIDIPNHKEPEDVIFDIDKFWPYYMNKKHWFFDNCRDVVYQDINKKKITKTHRELASMSYMNITEIDHGFGYGVKNPNWDDWGSVNRHSPGEDSFFERMKHRESDGSNSPVISTYRNFFGGPTVDVSFWGPTGDKYGLEEMAKIVQEDLCILRRRDDGWNLRAAAVCFPSYWSLKEKMGKPLDMIHGPVPQLTSDINEVITSKLDALEVDKPVERFNWTLTDDMQLHQPNSIRRNIPPNHHKFFVRVERQTMMMLRSGDILFTIRTYLNPLRAITQDQVLSTGLQNSILNTDPEVLNYRGIDRFGTQVMRVIDQAYQAWGSPAL
jgi:hypothetical protein